MGKVKDMAIMALDESAEKANECATKSRNISSILCVILDSGSYRAETLDICKDINSICKKLDKLEAKLIGEAKEVLDSKTYRYIDNILR